MWQALSATSPAALDAEVSAAAPHALAAPIEKLFTSLSFSHLAELIAIADPLKRAFTRLSASGATGRCAHSSARSTRCISSAPLCPKTRETGRDGASGCRGGREGWIGLRCVSTIRVQVQSTNRVEVQS